MKKERKGQPCKVPEKGGASFTNAVPYKNDKPEYPDYLLFTEEDDYSISYGDSSVAMSTDNSFKRENKTL